MTDFHQPLVDRLATIHDESPRDGHVVELAVGRRPGVARDLAARGVEVVATDLRAREVPDAVAFVRDDLTDPDVEHYVGASLLYARNLPAELQRPAAALAATVDAPLLFTTLGGEEPVIPVERETLAGESEAGRAGQFETLYRAGTGPGSA